MKVLDEGPALSGMKRMKLRNESLETESTSTWLQSQCSPFPQPHPGAVGLCLHRQLKFKFTSRPHCVEAAHLASDTRRGREGGQKRREAFPECPRVPGTELGPENLEMLRCRFLR